MLHAVVMAVVAVLMDFIITLAFWYSLSIVIISITLPFAWWTNRKSPPSHHKAERHNEN